MEKVLKISLRDYVKPFTDSPISLIDEKGEKKIEFSFEDIGITSEFAVKIYKNMVIAREIDRMGWILVRQGKAFFYISIGGQECAHIASLMALDREDLVMPFYRTPPALFVRGISLEDFFSQLMGKAQDPLKGRQMPGHLGKKDAGVFVLGSPVGLGHPVAMGVAMGIKYKKEKKTIISYGGEGSTSEGHFHSAMNFAGVYKLPLIIFIVNNQYAISVPRIKQTASKTIAIKAIGYGAKGYIIDGNDPFITYFITRKCVRETKEGKGPFLIEAYTYRYDPHSSADDDKKYRSVEELENWKKKDAIVRTRRFLEKEGLWDEEKEKNLITEIRNKLEKTVEEVEKYPEPDIKDMFFEVYKETPWYLKEEFEELKKEMEEK